MSQLPSFRCLWIIVAIAFICATNDASATDYHVYFLGGQSNMDGYGRVAELPDELKQPSDVMIFHGNTDVDGKPADGRGVWSRLQPGHGVGFKSDGESNSYSDRFGVELTFAQRVRELHPDRPIAIIKYSRGGTSIAEEAARYFGSWDPDFEGGDAAGRGVNQYDHFLATLRHAFAADDIDGDGEQDRLIPAGIVWMQGESDGAFDQATADAYRENLDELMELIRAALRHDDVPVVIGRISDSGQDGDGRVWDFGETVRQAQAEWVEADGHAVLVTSTDEYGYSDPYHYDSAGYLDLGRRFADALHSLPE